ncbi:MAG: hypothetical protein ABIK09_03740 [Pseudomonadota bacterium]
MKTLVVALIIATLLIPQSAVGKEKELPFSQGRFRISGGGGTTFGGGGFGLGLGFGYFVLDGLEVGLDGDIWLGGETLMGSLAPQVRYLLPYLYPVIPYAGIFYRHIFIEKPWDDQDFFGGRVGLLMSFDHRFMIGAGIVLQYALKDYGEDRFDIYPEIAFNFTF